MLTLGYAQSQTELDYVFSPTVITCTMTDRAGVQVKFNNIMREIKAAGVEKMRSECGTEEKELVRRSLQSLDSYTCIVHKAVNLCTAEDAVLAAHSAAKSVSGSCDDVAEETDSDVDGSIEIADSVLSIRMQRCLDGITEYQCLTTYDEYQWFEEEDVVESQAFKDYAAQSGAISKTQQPVLRKKEPLGKQLLFQINRYMCCKGEICM